MDIASLAGLVLCLGVMLMGIITSGGIQTVINFVDVPSFLITLGGAFMAVLASNSVNDFVAGFSTFSIILKQPADDMNAIIKQIIDLSNTARKEGLLALEEASGQLEDAFMKKGLLLIADGTEPELVKSIMEAEIDAMDGRHRSRIGFWEDVGAMGPAWGMIGTLIGLINMLNDMSDPDSIGPSMAVALITTMYGSVLANWICAPVASKLKKRNDAEYMLKSIVVEGLLSIQAGENPRVTEEKLKSFLSPANRAAYEAENGGAE